MRQRDLFDQKRACNRPREEQSRAQSPAAAHEGANQYKMSDPKKRLQAETAAELGVLPPAILDRACKGDL
jgi:hypothetical protein